MMTNKYGLPRAIVEIISRDEYDYKDDFMNISVSSLIDSPKIRRLKQLHAGEITEDVSDKIWLFFGIMGHKVMQDVSLNDRIMEVRFSEKIGDWTLTGKPDLFDTETKILHDYKVTSVWSYIFASEKKSYENQLNIYAYLLRGQGHKPVKLQNDLILRDWRKSEYRKSPDTYPIVGYAQLIQKQWDDKEAESYINERLALHLTANNSNPDDLQCSPEERWERKGDWAVFSFKKDGALKERADRKFDTEPEAKEYADKNTNATVIKERKGTDARCSGGYCDFCNYCNYYKDNYLNK
jgi:hypothetical protein